MNRALTAAACTLACMLFASAATAGVDYVTTNLSSNLWRYDYSITNTLTVPLNEITVFYDLSKYSELTLAASPSNWSSIVIQPDAGLPADGFFDTLALDSGLSPGQTEGGFSIQFKYSGASAPGSQLFDFVDSETFDILSSGDTTPSDSTGGGSGDGSGAMAAPEIDPSSFASAFTLLVGALAIMRSSVQPQRRDSHQD